MFDLELIFMFFLLKLIPHSCIIRISDDPYNCHNQSVWNILFSTAAYCNGGQEKLADGSCRTCPLGYYKDNSVYKFMSCEKCPINFVTSAPGADSAAKCNICK